MAVLLAKASARCQSMTQEMSYVELHGLIFPGGERKSGTFWAIRVSRKTCRFNIIPDQMASECALMIVCKAMFSGFRVFPGEMERTDFQGHPV